MRQTSLWRWLGGLGAVYGVLAVLTFFVLSGNTPDTKASGAAVVAYYNAHRGAQIASVLTGVLAALAFAFFIGAVCRSFRAKGDDGMSTIVAIGGAIYVGGFLLNAAIQIAVIDAAHYHMVATAQTVNVLGSDAFFPVVIGIAVVGIAIGIANARTRVLPSWLGWVTLALGIIGVAGPLGEIAFLLAPVWGIVVGVVLFLRHADPPLDA